MQRLIRDLFIRLMMVGIGFALLLLVSAAKSAARTGDGGANADVVRRHATILTDGDPRESSKHRMITAERSTDDCD